MNTLKKLRSKTDYTQKGLAEKVGVKKWTISSYEQGKRNITVPMAKKLGHVFDVSWTIFFEDELRETYDNERDEVKEK